MMELHTHIEEQHRQQFCPACFLAISGDSIALDPEVAVHSFAGCLMSWAGLDSIEQKSRTAEVELMADPASWKPMPSSLGPHWARRHGSDVFSNVVITSGVQGLVVKCGNTLREMASLRDHMFLQRSITHRCNAA